jgi:hypothetical protein
MEIDVIPLAKDFLSKNEISISDTTNPDELIVRLAKHIDALIFNIVSLVALVAIIQDQKKIQPKHLISAQAYIAKQCVGDHAIKKITGGMNKKGLKQRDLDNMPMPIVEGFELDEIAVSCVDIDMRSFIHKVLRFHDLTIGKGAMKGILDIVRSHLGCLLKNIRAIEPLTIKRLENIMSMRKHSVFQ